MIKRPTVIAGLIVACSITVLVLITALLSVKDTWPGYFVVLLYMIAGYENPMELRRVYAGGIVGILWSYGVSCLVAFLAPALGALPATAILVFLSMFLIVVLGDLSSTAFNNFTMIYFLVSGIYPKQEPVVWILALLAIGSAFAVMVLMGLRIFNKPIESEGK